MYSCGFFASTGVNFTNILRTNFLYEHCFCSFYYVHVTREKLPKQRSYKKFVCLTLTKLTTGWEAFFCRKNWANKKQRLANFSTQIRLTFCWWNWATKFYGKTLCVSIFFFSANKVWWNRPLLLKRFTKSFRCQLTILAQLKVSLQTPFLNAK